jgi:hypothetical protein
MIYLYTFKGRASSAPRALCVVDPAAIGPAAFLGAEVIVIAIGAVIDLDELNGAPTRAPPHPHNLQ